MQVVANHAASLILTGLALMLAVEDSEIRAFEFESHFESAEMDIAAARRAMGSQETESGALQLLQEQSEAGPASASLDKLGNDLELDQLRRLDAIVSGAFEERLLQELGLTLGRRDAIRECEGALAST